MDNLSAELRRALEAAHHELATLNGLMAYDGVDTRTPPEAFQIDTSKTMALIEQVLG